MIVPYDQIDDSVVGKVLVQLSHTGEEWWQRDPADRTPDHLPISAVVREEGHVRLLFGQLRYLSVTGRVVAGNTDAEKALASADLEHGIGPGGYAEVVA